MTEINIKIEDDASKPVEIPLVRCKLEGCPEFVLPPKEFCSGAHQKKFNNDKRKTKTARRKKPAA